MKKDWRSNGYYRNIGSPKGPVKYRRKPLLSSGGRLCGRKRPAGWLESDF